MSELMDANEPIGYLNPDAPEVSLPVYAGSRTEAMVPDTLDLADRAALGVHGLTGPTNPDKDYEIYWRVHWRYTRR